MKGADLVRVLVISDSHGNEWSIRAALEREEGITAVIHLGDGAREAVKLQAEFPYLDWHIVCGNCDIGADVPSKKIITLSGNKLYLTHGHAERVKSGLLTLSYTACEHEVTAALYGHTHLPSIDFRDGIMLMNPGSIGKDGAYAVLDFKGRDMLPALQSLRR